MVCVSLCSFSLDNLSWADVFHLFLVPLVARGPATDNADRQLGSASTSADRDRSDETQSIFKSMQATMGTCTYPESWH